MKYSTWKAWRRKHPGYRNQSRKRYYRKTAFSSRYYHSWEPLEHSLVMAHKMPDSLLSKLIGRSVESIQVRRSIHNKEGDGHVQTQPQATGSSGER